MKNRTRLSNSAIDPSVPLQNASSSVNHRTFNLVLKKKIVFFNFALRFRIHAQLEFIRWVLMVLDQRMILFTWTIVAVAPAKVRKRMMTRLGKKITQSIINDLDYWTNLPTSSNYETTVRKNVNLFFQFDLFHLIHFLKMYETNYRNRDILHPFNTSEPLSKLNFFFDKLMF